MPGNSILSSHDVRRVLRSLVEWEVAAACRRSGRPAPESIGAHVPLGEAGVGLDSLDLIDLSTTVAERFDLYASGAEDGLLRRPTLARWARLAHTAITSAGPQAAMVFKTSGSTGEARAHRHLLATLAAEAADFGALLPGARRVLAMAPPHHIYGFIHTVLLPAVAGVPVVDATHWGPGRLKRELCAGDLVVAFPLRWAQLSRLVGGFPPGVTGMTSTAPMPAELAWTLARLGLSRLVQVYGSTETAGVAWRDDPEAPFELLPRYVRGREDDTVEEAGGGPGVALPDRVEWRGERLLMPTGRRDAAVQVAGVNVWPQRVAQALCAHPDVADCAVRPMRADEGQRLKAFVVLRPGCRDEAPLREALARFVQTRLAPPERPALSFGERLPVDAAGKCTDWQLQA